MSDRSRFRTALLTLAAGAAGAIVAVAGALLLLEVFSFVAAPLRIQLTRGMRYTVIGGALLGVVPSAAGAVLRARRPSTDVMAGPVPSADVGSSRSRRSLGTSRAFSR